MFTMTPIERDKPLLPWQRAGVFGDEPTDVAPSRTLDRLEIVSRPAFLICVKASQASRVSLGSLPLFT
jgi:hypothetical protein